MASLVIPNRSKSSCSFKFYPIKLFLSSFLKQQHEKPQPNSMNNKFSINLHILIDSLKVFVKQQMKNLC